MMRRSDHVFPNQTAPIESCSCCVPALSLEVDGTGRGVRGVRPLIPGPSSRTGTPSGHAHHQGSSSCRWTPTTSLKLINCSRRHSGLEVHRSLKRQGLTRGLETRTGLDVEGSDWRSKPPDWWRSLSQRDVNKGPQSKHRAHKTPGNTTWFDRLHGHIHHRTGYEDSKRGNVT
ncbi:unnamed protein product [Pleuronectes platessa]|uniref:Uncharacterized protein n=1 Tax=Pleuronectes platessa TaxID=8262 RepID=A0A9N7URH1_PLEPL|nr:unnamed protein product [Pleuronectes platessa]